MHRLLAEIISCCSSSSSRKTEAGEADYLDERQWKTFKVDIVVVVADAGKLFDLLFIDKCHCIRLSSESKAGYSVA